MELKKYINKEISEFVEYLSEVSEITRIKKLVKKYIFISIIFMTIFGRK